jgi:hypothetical protein
MSRHWPSEAQRQLRHWLDRHIKTAVVNVSFSSELIERASSKQMLDLVQAKKEAAVRELGLMVAKEVVWDEQARPPKYGERQMMGVVHVVLP